MTSNNAKSDEKLVLLNAVPKKTKMLCQPAQKSVSFERVVLWASLAFNVLLSLALVGYYHRLPPHELSRYAKVPHTTTAYNFSTLYGARGLEDEHYADQLWDVHSATGMVTLENTKAKEMGLPSAQPFPWDENYSMYTISGMHSMNCLRKLRRAIRLSQQSRQQLDTYSHLLYCVDILRQDVTCHADDTLISTSNTGMNFYKGEGQQRECRNWNVLEDWYQANRASVSSLEAP